MFPFKIYKFRKYFITKWWNARLLDELNMYCLDIKSYICIGNGALLKSVVKFDKLKSINERDPGRKRWRWNQLYDF